MITYHAARRAVMVTAGFLYVFSNFWNFSIRT